MQAAAAVAAPSDAEQQPQEVLLLAALNGDVGAALELRRRQLKRYELRRRQLRLDDELKRQKVSDAAAASLPSPTPGGARGSSGVPEANQAVLLDALLRHALSGAGAWIDGSDLVLPWDAPAAAAAAEPTEPLATLDALHSRVFLEDRLRAELSAREASLRELRSQSTALVAERDALLTAAGASAAGTAGGVLRPRFQMRDGEAAIDRGGDLAAATSTKKTS